MGGSLGAWPELCQPPPEGPHSFLQLKQLLETEQPLEGPPSPHTWPLGGIPSTLSLTHSPSGGSPDLTQNLGGGPTRPHPTHHLWGNPYSSPQLKLPLGGRTLPQTNPSEGTPQLTQGLLRAPPHSIRILLPHTQTFGAVISTPHTHAQPLGDVPTAPLSWSSPSGVGSLPKPNSEGVPLPQPLTAPCPHSPARAGPAARAARTWQGGRGRTGPGARARPPTRAQPIAATPRQPQPIAAGLRPLATPLSEPRRPRDLWGPPRPLARVGRERCGHAPSLREATPLPPSGFRQDGGGGCVLVEGCGLTRLSRRSSRRLKGLFTLREVPVDSAREGCGQRGTTGLSSPTHTTLAPPQG